jgi:hypothetical protein
LQCTSAFKGFISLAEYIARRFEAMRRSDNESDREAITRHYWHDIQSSSEKSFVAGIKVGSRYNVNYTRLTLLQYLLLIEDIESKADG